MLCPLHLWSRWAACVFVGEQLAVAELALARAHRHSIAMLVVRCLPTLRGAKRDPLRRQCSRCGHTQHKVRLLWEKAFRRTCLWSSIVGYTPHRYVFKPGCE
mmetsp:Transcript_15308/g.35824  ORF Transcript_15308/g.35824 Transcript_15308/m.35824 type:complete len:102 (-) Transcript_15308:74-379(-)